MKPTNNTFNNSTGSKSSSTTQRPQAAGQPYQNNQTKKPQQPVAGTGSKTGTDRTGSTNSQAGLGSKIGGHTGRDSSDKGGKTGGW